MSHGEQQNLVKILDKNHDNLESIYYAATSLNALGKSLSSSDEHCKIAINKVDQGDSESVFQFSEVVKTLKCKVSKDMHLHHFGDNGLQGKLISCAIFRETNISRKSEKL